MAVNDEAIIQEAGPNQFIVSEGSKARRPMTEAQEAHLDGIKGRTSVALDRKYRKGQAEHGGNLWRKPGVFSMLDAEVIDFVVYADTLRQQLEDVLALMKDGQHATAFQRLDGILHGPDEG